MFKYSILLLVLTAVVLAGCYPGGGGGRYYPPKVALNPYHIERHSFDAIPAALTARQEIPAKLGYNDASDDRHIGGVNYKRFNDVMFQGQTFTLAMPVKNWLAVLDPSENVVARLETPRYARYAVGVELTKAEASPYLAILIQQQASSHSSTLYILDSSLKPVYKEHLLGAKWMGKVASSRGDILYIATEDKWLQQGRWETVGGKWRYSVFQAINGVDNGGKLGDLN